jgi:hypothetical protein
MQGFVRQPSGPAPALRQQRGQVDAHACAHALEHESEVFGGHIATGAGCMRASRAFVARMQHFELI